MGFRMNSSLAVAPKVSIIVIPDGEDGPVSEAIASVLAQRFSGFEVILVEEGPSPGTPSQPDAAAGADARVRRISNPRPGSLAESLNYGVRESRSDWLVWLDARDRLEPDMLGECLRLVESDPAIAIAYGDLLDSDGEGKTRPSGEFDFKTLTREDIIPYCALFSKKAWLDVGGFRTNVKNGEAWDFWIACGARGFLGRRVPHPLARSRRVEWIDRKESQVARNVRISQMRLNNRECFSQEEIHAAELLLGQAAGGAGVSYNLSRIPMVSVIIPTYNRPDTLKTAIESVQAQSFRDFEIVVVSDCGSNFLEAMINGMNTRQNITYVRHGMNRGLGASRNTGLGAARGKYVAYLDDDDFFYPDHLETLVDYLEKTGEKVAYTDAHRVWQRKVDGVYRESGRDAPYTDDFRYDVILIHNMVPVLCFLHARECIREVGGFDETLSTHEDWDLWIRMSRKYVMHRIPKFTSAFTHRDDGSSMSSRRRMNFLDTTVSIYAKYSEFSEGNPEIRAAQARRLTQMRLEYGVPEPAPIVPPIAPLHRNALDRLNAGDADGAATALLALASGDGSGNAGLHNDLANALYRSGKPEQAEIHFRKSLALDPGRASSSRDYGNFCFRQGRLQEALEHLRKAYQLDPEDKETSMCLGELSESVGQIEVARQFYVRVLEIDGSHPGARGKMASAGPGSAPPGTLRD
jgi:glycosyltransferase involved in cell wall biosynthesis